MENCYFWRTNILEEFQVLLDEDSAVNFAIIFFNTCHVCFNFHESKDCRPSLPSTPLINILQLTSTHKAYEQILYCFCRRMSGGMFCRKNWKINVFCKIRPVAKIKTPPKFFLWVILVKSWPVLAQMTLTKRWKWDFVNFFLLNCFLDSITNREFCNLLSFTATYCLLFFFHSASCPVST